MAIVKTKGTVLQMTISSVLTSIAQVISLNRGEDKNESFDADYLAKSGAGIPKAATGRTAVGNISGEKFYDPANATHQFWTGLLDTPADVDGKIVLADTDTSEITFTSVAVGMGLAVALGDGLKAPFSMDLEDLPVWPSA